VLERLKGPPSRLMVSMKRSRPSKWVKVFRMDSRVVIRLLSVVEGPMVDHLPVITKFIY